MEVLEVDGPAEEEASDPTVVVDVDDPSDEEDSEDEDANKASDGGSGSNPEGEESSEDSVPGLEYIPGEEEPPVDQETSPPVGLESEAAAPAHHHEVSGVGARTGLELIPLIIGR